MRFETDTMRFRIAITLAALWMLFSGFKFYSTYQAIPKPNYFDVFSTPEYEACSYSLPGLGQSADDIKRCQDATAETARKFADESYRSAQMSLIINGLISTLLIPAIFLAVVAFWTSIRGLALTTVRSYLRWVKSGTTKT